jgi:hypothetical protein
MTTGRIARFFCFSAPSCAITDTPQAQILSVHAIVAVAVRNTNYFCGFAQGMH